MEDIGKLKRNLRIFPYHKFIGDVTLTNKLIIDGPYLAHRSYRGPFKLTAPDGRDSTLIHGFLRSLNSMRKKFNPRIIEVAWESPKSVSWRRTLVDTYKPPKKRENEFINEIKDLQMILYQLNVKQFKSPQNEADDVVAVLSQSGDDNVIFTVDKDIMQLVDNKVRVWDGKRLFDERDVYDKFRVKPCQIPDYLAIVGDSADSIIGLNGYGPKKASAILNEYDTLDSWLESCGFADDVKESLLLNKKLATLNKSCTPEEMFFSGKNLMEMLDMYGLKKIKENVNEYKKLGKIKPSSSLEEFF